MASWREPNLTEIVMDFTESGNDEEMERLVKRDDVKDWINKEKCGGTPLHWACEACGRFKVVKCLLVAGANVDVIDSHNGDSPIGLAFAWSHSSIVDLFIEMDLKGQLSHQDGGNLLHAVCKERRTSADLVKKLLEAGVDASKRDKHGKLPLDYVPDEKQNKAELARLLSNDIPGNENQDELLDKDKEEEKEKEERE